MTLYSVYWAHRYSGTEELVATVPAIGDQYGQPPRSPRDKSAIEGGRKVCTAPFGRRTVQNTLNSGKSSVQDTCCLDFVILQYISGLWG